jgi:hypothetical protein
MAVKKSFVSELPVQDAAARSSAGGSPVAEGRGEIAGLGGEGLRAVAVTVGLGAAEGSPGGAADLLGSGVVVDTAGEPQAAAARSAIRRRMAGPGT